MLLDSIRLMGLFLMQGGMLFYLLAWRPLLQQDHVGLDRQFHRRSLRIMLVAGGVYLAAVLVQLWLAYHQSTQTDPSLDIVDFLSSSGKSLVLFNLMLVPVMLAGFHRCVTVKGYRHLFWTVLAGMFILLFEATSSHAAAGPGLLPYLTNLIHLLTAIVWAGGLCFLALLPWQGLVDHADTSGSLVRQLDQRFYNLILIMFIVVVVSGTVLAFVQVHSEVALHITLYGKALKLKLTLVFLLSLMASIHLLKTGRMLKGLTGADSPSNAGQVFSRYRRLVRLEAIIVFGLLICTATIRSHDPPDTAPFLNPQTLMLSAQGQPVRIAIQPVAGNVNAVRMEIFLPPPLAGGDATQVFFRLSMPDGALVLEEDEAIRVSADSYQGEALFPVPGDWQIDVRIAGAGGDVVLNSSGFSIPGQPLIGDISTYLSLQAVIYDSGRLISFVTGLLLVIIYGWLALQARCGNVPKWISLTSVACILFGAYLVMSVALVKTYRTTYTKNPLPLITSVVTSGQQAYTATCAECHGAAGRGDGPWAIENRGSIPDLGSPHMDVHTDGEIFWWITRGIPELDMPPREQELTVQARWQLINYIRSLRHGTMDG